MYLVSNTYHLSNFISETIITNRTQITGITLIVDPKGFGFRQLRHWTLDFARNATHFVQVMLSISKINRINNQGNF